MTEKKTFLTLEQTREIAKTCPAPSHVYDKRSIRENAARVAEALSWNKGFREYFAVKATPNPLLLKTLQEYGYGVDCSSGTELMMSDVCGFSGKQIMFSSNDTPTGEFVLVVRFGDIIDLDDITHISSVEEELGRLPETMGCRYNPGSMSELSNGVMDNLGDSKYGMTSAQITEAFRILKAKGIKRSGPHTFLASNTTTNEYYSKLTGILLREAACLKEETGAETTFINLSGGVGIPYRPKQQADDILATGREVRKAYEGILMPAGSGNAAIYMEVGCFMLVSYGTLVTKAIREKHIYKEYIGVDTCTMDPMRPTIYGTYHHITVLDRKDAPLDHVYDVTDPSCESNNRFAIGRELPGIEMRDYLYTHDTGAHGFSMSYSYSGKLRSVEFLLREDGSAQLIRRAETPKDYSATFGLCDIMDKYLK